jgi:DNA-binding transcriptional LysR family regulator
MNVWNGISELVAVVEAGSFSAAAQQLGVSTSYVSRQVSQLEARLGVRLLSRSTRKIRLTDAGAEYYRRCAELAAGLEEANQQVTKETGELSGRIRISLAGAFAERYVAPALADFALLHPKISIELNFNSRRVNLIEEGFDFAIRYGVLEESGLVAHKLVQRKLVACASSDYIKQMGYPVDPEELKEHACLRSNSERWRFLYPEGHRYIRVSGPWTSNNVSALVAAATRGLGIIYLPRSSIFHELNSGSLVPLLQDYCDVDSATWIVYADSRHLPLRVHHAIQFLLKRFRDQWNEDEA